jgi:hypothetical protein
LCSAYGLTLASRVVKVGISDAAATTNPMTNATVVINWVDRFGNGYGYVANAVSTAAVAPTFTTPPTVPASVIGVSQLVRGQDDLVIVQFEKPAATWVGANKQLMFAWKESDANFQPDKAPEAGKVFLSGKHTESLKVQNFDFSVASPTCDVPGPPAEPVVPVDPCGGKPLLANGVAVTLGDTTVQLNAIVDCAAKEVEFTVSGETDGWLAFAFNENAQMAGSDTYQVYLEADGTAKVRNGNAVGRTVTENNIIAASGYRQERLLSVTFKRKFDTGNAGDKVLDFGKKFFINVSRKDVAGALPTAKHDETASSNVAVDLLRDGGLIPGGPCNEVASFDNQIQGLQIGADRYELSVRVDCVRAEATFTIRGKSKGWLAFAFNSVAGMPGQDSYQVTVDGAGKVLVRNGFAPGSKSVSEDALITGGVGERTGDIIRVVFKRPLFTGSPRDVPLIYGRRYFVNVARSDAANAPFTQKHGEKTPGATAIEILRSNQVVQNPCKAGVKLENSVVVPLDTTEVTVAYVIDCDAEKIRFTVTGETTGWLSLGFTEFPNKMSGADTYQMRATATGAIEVRNGRAVGRAVVEDALLGAANAVSGSVVGNVMTATFERAFDTSNPGKDVVFAFGVPLTINVARRNIDNDWTKKHDFRNWSPEPIELFVAGAAAAPTTGPAPVAGDPCVTPTSKFENTAEVALAGSPVKIVAKGNCATKEIEFTVTGTSKGWLAFGFNKADSMDQTDTYQVSVVDGTAKVRNGFANGYTIKEDAVISATGSRTGDTLTVTFKRPFASANGANDVSFAVGAPFFINVVKRDTDADMTKKHTVTASSPAAVDLFKASGGGAGTTQAPVTMAASGDGVKDGPCAKADEFEGKFEVDLDGGDVSVEYEVDCEDATVTFAVKASVEKPEEAWLAIGFVDKAQSMANTDTYQLRVVDGKAEVRNGFAKGKSVVEDEVFAADEGSAADGKLSVKFTRPLKSTRATDVDLSAGKAWFVNVALCTADNDWESKHTARAWTSSAVDMWGAGAVSPDAASRAGVAAAAVAAAATLLLLPQL